MGRDLEAAALLKVFSVGLFAGTAAFLFMPLILTGVVSYFTASFVGVAVSVPLIAYFLDIPTEGLDFQDYYRSRRLVGIIADVLMTLLSAFAPGLIFLYGLLRSGILPPVPVAFSAAIAIFTGYSAFLYRNRKFYRSDRVDIQL